MSISFCFQFFCCLFWLIRFRCFVQVFLTLKIIFLFLFPINFCFLVFWFLSYSLWFIYCFQIFLFFYFACIITLFIVFLLGCAVLPAKYFCFKFLAVENSFVCYLFLQYRCNRQLNCSDLCFSSFKIFIKKKKYTKSH